MRCAREGAKEDPRPEALSNCCHAQLAKMSFDQKPSIAQLAVVFKINTRTREVRKRDKSIVNEGRKVKTLIIHDRGTSKPS